MVSNLESSVHRKLSARPSTSKEIIELSEKIMESDAKKDFSLWEMLNNVRTLLKLKKKTKG